MANVVWLRDNLHRQAQSVLPWYVTGRLDAAERAAVDEHLANCAACREDLQAEREIAALLGSDSADMEATRALQQRLQARKRRDEPWHIPAWIGRLGWLLTGSALAASLIAIVAVPRFVRADYHALDAPAAEVPGNVIVMFRPDTSERELRSLLTASRARLADGPTASGAYVLRVPQTKRAAILAKFEADESIVLAQPLDADLQR